MSNEKKKHTIFSQDVVTTTGLDMLIRDTTEELYSRGPTLELDNDDE